MLKTVALFAVVTIVTHMAMTIYAGKKEEDRYFNFIASGKFLTERTD
jgi:hypothetical protein